VPTGADRADTKALLMKPPSDGYAVGLWRYAPWRTGAASHAEDVVEETLLRAWQHPDAKWRRVIGSMLRPPRDNPSPWVSVPVR
jgi:DNA-directed RNA polymerase specialized sigma24 family protein